LCACNRESTRVCVVCVCVCVFTYMLGIHFHTIHSSFTTHTIHAVPALDVDGVAAGLLFMVVRVIGGRMWIIVCVIGGSVCSSVCDWWQCVRYSSRTKKSVWTTLHYTTLHYTTHLTTLHYTSLHHTTQYTTLHTHHTPPSP
jgi:hypothetical protein